MQYADLSNVDLSHADLCYANLKGAHLEFSDLSHANLSNTTMAYSTLMAVKFIDSVLHNTDMAGAHLNNADLTGANLSDVSFFFTELQKAESSYINVINANFRKAKYCIEEGSKTKLPDNFDSIKRNMQLVDIYGQPIEETSK